MNRKLKNEELARLTAEEFKAAKKRPITVVLENVRSMNNVGSVFRTCDAFLVEKVYLCGITPKPPHRDIHKTALGATETVEWEYVEDISKLLLKLKKEEKYLAAIEQAEKTTFLKDFEMPEVNKKGLVIVFGNEVEGVSQKAIDIVDDCIEIEQSGTKHSLNISVCAGIVLWSLSNKLNQ